MSSDDRYAMPASSVAPIALLVSCCWLAVAEISYSLTMDPNPIASVSNYDGSIRTLELIEASSGIPQGGVVLAGAVDPGDISLVFQLSQEAGTGPLVVLLMSLGLTTGPLPGSLPNVPIGGAGWIPGNEPDSLVDFHDIEVMGSLAWLRLSGTFENATTDLFFLSFDQLPVDGTVGVCFGSGALIVPEPRTGFLLASGLTLIANMRRRQRFASR